MNSWNRGIRISIPNFYLEGDNVINTFQYIFSIYNIFFFLLLKIKKANYFYWGTTSKIIYKILK